MPSYVHAGDCVALELGDRSFLPAVTSVRSARPALPAARPFSIEGRAAPRLTPMACLASVTRRVALQPPKAGSTSVGRSGGGGLARALPVRRIAHDFPRKRTRLVAKGAEEGEKAGPFRSAVVWLVASGIGSGHPVQTYQAHTSLGALLAEVMASIAGYSLWSASAWSLLVTRAHT
jgi:hypothetical protein